MIQRISQHVNQRIIQAVNHNAVHFGFSTGNDQIDIFTQITCQFTNQTRELLEQTTNRLHTCRQCGALQFGRVTRCAGQRFRQCGHDRCSLSVKFELTEFFQQNSSLICRLNRLACHFQQRVQFDGINTDTFFFCRRILFDRSVRRCQRCFNGFCFFANAGRCRCCGYRCCGNWLSDNVSDWFRQCAWRNDGAVIGRPVNLAIFVIRFCGNRCRCSSDRRNCSRCSYRCWCRGSDCSRGG